MLLNWGATYLFLLLLLLLLLFLRCFGPFSGHGHPVVRVSRQLSFYGVRVSAPRSALNLEGRCLSLCPAPRSKAVRHGWPYLQLGCRQNSVPVQQCTQATYAAKNAFHNVVLPTRKTSAFQIDMCTKTSPCPSLKIPSQLHTINGTSKLKNRGTPSPTENINSLIFACCKHLVVDNRRHTNCVYSLLRCHVT